MDTNASYTPKQNSISESGDWTTTERARCILIDGNLPKRFWAEAAATAVYIENRSPEASINLKAPHELWYGQSQTYLTYVSLVVLRTNSSQNNSEDLNSLPPLKNSSC